MSEAVDVKTLVIGEKEVSARRGQTILQVARENDIDVPNFCHLDGLTDVGALPVDVSHERFTLDHNRCILCTRCVRVCAEREGAHVWDVMGRGIDSLIISA